MRPNGKNKKRWTLLWQFFTCNERRGVVLLGIGVILLYAAIQAVMLRHDRTAPDGENQPKQQTAEGQHSFADNLSSKQGQPDEAYPPSSDEGRQAPVRLTPVAFDPNTADSLTLRRLGLPQWMVSNVLRYRSKGGRFRRAEDFRKIYGLTQQQFDTLRPYIVIAPADDDSSASVPSVHSPSATQQTSPLLFASQHTDSLPARPQVQKYAPGTTVDLNRADTTELKKIPGIGSGIARLISNYRRQLGGFYRVEQLGEIGLDHRQLAAWFRIDTTALQRLDVNRTGIERLRRHPYLNFYQAKAIVEYRRKHGPLKSLKPLALYEEFTPDDLERLSHYLSFE